MQKRVKFISAGIFFLIIGALGFHNNQKKIKGYEKFVSQREEFISNNIASDKQFSLPEFSSVDIFGNKIDSSSLKGKKTFIQFIDPNSESQRKTLKKVYQNTKNDNLTIMAIVKDSESHMFDIFMDEMRFAIGDIYIVTKDYEKHKEIFNASPCCETFHLFDKSGNLVLTDISWKLLKIKTGTLLERLNNKELTVLSYIKSGKNIKELEGFEQIFRLIEKNEKNKNFIISMFTNICIDCPSGNLVNELKKSYKQLNQSVDFHVILSDSYNENDINNLKELLKIEFPVIIADENLMKKWIWLTLGIEESKISNIVFLLDKKGKITRVMKPNQYKEFFNYINYLYQ